jgi:hypothetical protein
LCAIKNSNILKTVALTVVIIFLLTAKGFSQYVVDSLMFIQPAPLTDILTTGFEKQLNTYLLTSSLNLTKSFDNIAFSLKENYNSSFIRSAIQSIREENFLRFSTSYNINRYLNLGILANNNDLSDSRNIEINKATQSSAAFYTQYKPEDRIYISPFFGYITNDQTGEADYGSLYGIEGLFDDIKFSDSYLTSQIKFRNEDISPRKNTIRYFNFILTNNFSDISGNIINASYSQNRKDFYFAADSLTAREYNITNNIQSRIESNYFLQDKFTTKSFLDLFDLDFTGSFLWKTVDRDTRYRYSLPNASSLFDTKVNELNLGFESMATYNSSFFNGTIKLIYSNRDENHLTKNYNGANQIQYQETSSTEDRKNNKALRGALVFNGIFNLSKTDHITLSLYQNKLQYDTPSTDNYDDRDEMLSIIRLQYSKSLSPFFGFFINTDATISTTDYIYSEESSNNNINRIIRLNVGGSYRGKYFSTINSFEVSANYTVYDFEDINPNYRSFSFRQFTARDSSTVKLSRDLSFSTNGYVKLSEQGNLKWASFSTNPIRYLEEIFSESKFIVNYGWVQFSLGARVYSLNTYNYNNGEKVIDSKFLSLAPLTEIVILMKESLYLRLYGWYEFITQNAANKREEANLSFQTTWSF